jgi:hypothetical protein
MNNIYHYLISFLFIIPAYIFKLTKIRKPYEFCMYKAKMHIDKME